MNKKRVLSLVAATMLSVAVLAGCGKKEESSALKDGKYEVASKAADDKGYITTLTMEVKDGKITTVSYDEAKDGASKKDDAGYNENMKKVSGTNPAEAFPALEKSMVDKQSAEVDVVTGATGTTSSFKAYAAKAIENAKAGKTEKALMD